MDFSTRLVKMAYGTLNLLLTGQQREPQVRHITGNLGSIIATNYADGKSANATAERVR